MLPDSAKIQEQDAKFLAKRGRDYVPPLYNSDDADLTVERMIPMPYHTTFDVVAGVRATFLDAGHILGSATVVLDCTEGNRTRRIVFSGDIGRSGLALLRDPETPEGVHALLLESTYGNRLHEPVDGAREHLARTVRETAARGGRVLIPAFAVGRTQELIYDLHVLTRAGRIPEIPIWIDSPLATRATEIFGKHPHIFDREEALISEVRNVFEFPQVNFTKDVSESKALNSATGPMIIISASGMAESGRILHHLRYGAGDARNTVLVVGFMAEHTLGRRIVEKRGMLRILGDDTPLRAHVEIINGYSAHADQAELVAWVEQVRESSPELAECFLVHGERPAQEVLAPLLEGKGMSVSAPAPGHRVEIGSS